MTPTNLFYICLSLLLFNKCILSSIPPKLHNCNLQQACINIDVSECGCPDCHDSQSRKICIHWKKNENCYKEESTTIENISIPKDHLIKKNWKSGNVEKVCTTGKEGTEVTFEIKDGNEGCDIGKHIYNNFTISGTQNQKLDITCQFNETGVFHFQDSIYACEWKMTIPPCNKNKDLSDLPKFVHDIIHGFSNDFDLEMDQVNGMFEYHHKPGLLNLFTTAKNLHENFKDTKYFKKQCKDAEAIQLEKSPHACLGPTISLIFDGGVCVINEKTYEVICSRPSVSIVKRPAKCYTTLHPATTIIGKDCTDVYEIGEIKEKIYGGKIFNTINIEFNNPLKDLDMIRHGAFDFSDLFHHIVKLLKP